MKALPVEGLAWILGEWENGEQLPPPTVDKCKTPGRWGPREN